MLLLCCNPELNPKAQVCLTLKSACGFSVQEIAHALDMQAEAVKKIISRAKHIVAQDPTALQTLRRDKIAERFVMVMETLYAVFNEGYSASGGDTQLRRDVAEQAVYLADIFLRAQVTPEEYKGDLHALIALMLLQFARFDARRNEAGTPVRLQEQDRSRWNPTMVRAGIDALAASQNSPRVTVFHIEARIAAEHATSPSFAETNWTSILGLYDRLLLIKDTPAVRLGRIVALEQAQGWEPALHELALLEETRTFEVSQSFLFHAVRANLLESAKRPLEAAAEWAHALDAAPTRADRAFVEKRLKTLP